MSRRWLRRCCSNCHIICHSDIKMDLQGLLSEDDLNVVLRSKHRPRCISEFITQSLYMLDFDENKRSIMELVFVSSSLGFLFLCHTLDLLQGFLFYGISNFQ